MPAASASTAYRTFMHDRNAALESMLANFRVRQTNLLSHALLEVGNYLAAQIIMQRFEAAHQIQAQISAILYKIAPELHVIQSEMLKRTYLLSKAATAEAIAQASERETKYAGAPQVQDALEGYKRTIYYLDRLSRKIIDAYQLGIVLEEEPKEIMERVVAVMPKRTAAKKPPLTRPKKLTEAEAKPLKDFSLGTITDNDWEDILADVLMDVLPVSRGPEDLIDVPKDLSQASGVDQVYAWEYERDLTEEFVQSVRDGENDAARENGVEEFIHVAVIDKRTDECCAWRDGLTVTEIEEKLAGEREDDACLGTVPPLHPNCRCRLEPVLDSLNDRVSSEAKDFQRWLET